MKHIFLYIAILIGSANALVAQTTEDSVKATVNQIFEGMKNADASLIQSAFADSGILQTVALTKDGRTVIRTQNFQDFLKQIGTLPKGMADERIEFGTIRIDGSLASVWTPYKFYASGKFSHCGVNSFQLVRLDGRWRIQYIIDTRRKTGCE